MKIPVLMSAIFLIADVACALMAPTSLCGRLQNASIVSDCHPGAPWAFEVIRKSAQYEFVPTNSEIFQCYTVSDGFTHKPCKFKGTIIQFDKNRDLTDAIEYINRNNHHENLSEDLSANVIRSDTTLEHYIFYKFSAHRVLIVMPVTENGVQVQQKLEAMFGKSEDI
jgi:hypothetical protein